jgi:hypothetical protein
MKKVLKNCFENIKLINEINRKYIKQRRIDLRWVSPWDHLEKYKKIQANVPRLEDVPPFKKVTVKDRLLDQNIKELEDDKKKNLIYDDEILKEEPRAQEYVDWVERVTPKEGRWNRKSERVGAIAIKVGMFPHYNEYFRRYALTCLWVKKIFLIIIIINKI